MSLYNADTEALIEQQLLEAAKTVRAARPTKTHSGTNGTMLTYQAGQRPYGPIRPVRTDRDTAQQLQAAYQQALTTWRVRELKRTRQTMAAGKAS